MGNMTDGRTNFLVRCGVLKSNLAKARIRAGLDLRGRGWRRAWYRYMRLEGCLAVQRVESQHACPLPQDLIHPH